jgi:hypothetical protein
MPTGSEVLSLQKCHIQPLKWDIQPSNGTFPLGVVMINGLRRHLSPAYGPRPTHCDCSWRWLSGGDAMHLTRVWEGPWVLTQVFKLLISVQSAMVCKGKAFILQVWAKDIWITTLRTINWFRKMHWGPLVYREREGHSWTPLFTEYTWTLVQCTWQFVVLVFQCFFTV